MFERFTDRARWVVVRAQEEARLLNHDYIGTEHVLLGLVREGEGIGAKSLESLGVSLQAVRSQVEDLIGRGGSTPTGHIPFTPRAKKVLELALREALALGHDYIGTEHLLLGLVREGEGVAAQVLRKLGADLSRVRATVIDLLSGHQASGTSAPGTGGTGPPAGAPVARTVFVVHGPSGERPGEVAQLVERLTGRRPVMLDRQPDGGRAVIAAFEESSRPAVAVVILSGADEGRSRTGDDDRLHRRAAQPVVYEMGWLHGRLGRHAVIALIEEGVEAPSDSTSGVVPIPLDAEDVWRLRLAEELRAAGLEVDLDDIG